MKFIKLALMAALMLMVLASVSFAKDDDPEKAMAMVKKAVAFYKANGLEKFMNEVNNPKGQFMDGAYYVWLYDMDATVIAHPANAKLVGQNVINFKDADGKEFVKEIMSMAKAKNSGWTDYKFKNPKSNEVEQKSAYFEKVDDIVVCCGIYKKK